MPIPVSVVLDRQGGAGPLELTPLVDGNSLTWSSVIPGGFASCSLQLNGDPRTLQKQVPYLAILRIVGDSGRVLFEGQIEDLSITVSDSGAGLRVGAFGLQNLLQETSIRTIWSKRDLTWRTRSPVMVVPDPAISVQTGNFDSTDLTKSGVAFVGGNGTTAYISAGKRIQQYYQTPSGVTLQRLMLTYDKSGNANLVAGVDYSTNNGGAFTNVLTSATNVTGSAQNFSVPAANLLLLSAEVQTADFATVVGDFVKFYNIRVLGTSVTEDASGGFFGDSLIKNLLTLVPGLGQGIIESGSDFTIDHLDASIRRTAYDILQEVVQYYKREWAVWEDALFHWKTPNLQQHQWIVGLNELEALDLDASVVNSKRQAIVMYTDAASGITAEATASATDRRNPYVLANRTKDELINTGFAMTSSAAGREGPIGSNPMTGGTSAQLASIILNDLGFGIVPASGTVRVKGEQIISHAQGNSVKAWEIRAGDNITIPDLPLADIFTQDGRGENLFHVVSAEANAADGTMTFSLDSFGSRRSDVLLARLAAVTRALTG